MSATNSTTNYELPIYVASDTPKYLTDFNQAMTKIDTAIKGVDDKTNDGNEALTKVNQLETEITELSEDVGTATSNSSQALQKATQNENDINTLETQMSSANTNINKANNILASFFEGFTNFKNWTPSE